MRCDCPRRLWVAAVIVGVASAALGCGAREPESLRAIRLSPAEPLETPQDLEDLLALIPPMPVLGEPLPPWPFAPRAPTGDPLRDRRQRERELEILRHRLAGIDLGLWKCADDIVWSNQQKKGPQAAARAMANMASSLKMMFGQLVDRPARLHQELIEYEASIEQPR